MENMTATASDAGRGRQGLNVTNGTVLVTINSVELSDILSTFFIQTGETGFFTPKSIA